MKLLKRILFFFIIAIIVAFAFHLYSRLSYASPKAYFTIDVKTRDSALSIGIIGDSWVSYHKLDTLLADAFLQKDITTKIISSGKDGARTKQIYQAMFNNDTSSFSCKSIIQQQPDYCIIIAGVNDAQSFTGAGNYAHHMVLMVKTLLHYNIKPVVLTLPQFDVIKAQQNIGVHRTIRNKASAMLTGEPENNINLFRQAFKQELASQQHSDSIILVDFDKFCVDYKKCSHLYKDALHLSVEGNRQLCELMAGKITGNNDAIGLKR